MCWLRNIMEDSSIEDNSNMSEGVDNMGNANSESKKRFIMNWQFSVGLLLYAITTILKRTVGLPDFFMGFGEGLSIVLIFFGFLAAAGKTGYRLIKSKRKLLGR